MGKKKPPELPGAPAWMMTFSDITTLLLTFFILIMTFSTIEREKFEKAKGSFKGAFGVVAEEEERSRPLLESRHLTLNDRIREEGAESPRRTVPHEIAKKLHRLLDGQRMQLDTSSRHWRIRLPGAFAFFPGRARVRADVERVYSRIARQLRDYPNIVVLEGHTDSEFLSSDQHPTAWDLAGARAAAVADIMRRAGFPDDQIALRSYGDSRPEVPNDSTMNRARNRRVDILVLGAAEKAVDR